MGLKWQRLSLKGIRMTLDELIAALVELRGTSEKTGKLPIKLTCPVAAVNCWIHDDGISVVHSEMDPTKFVRIEGGIGA